MRPAARTSTSTQPGSLDPLWLAKMRPGLAEVGPRFARLRPAITGLMLTGATLAAAQTTMHVDSGTAQQPTVGLHGVPGDRVTEARLHAGLPQTTSGSSGEAWFTFIATYNDPVTHAETPVTVRVPLSSTGYPYGEERSCDLSDPAHPRLVFSAGLDEKNYLPFRSASGLQPIEFSLNKYLCRVLAAPFRCGNTAVSFPAGLAAWTVAKEAGVTLTSDAPATLRSTPVVVTSGGSFDRAQCAVVAPSNGLCCVQGRTTEWHCGGTPVGEGWHQVSGECFHRETGGACKD